MSISHPLKSDEDGHLLLRKVRTGMATALSLDDSTTLLFGFGALLRFIWLCYETQDMWHVNPPPFQVRGDCHHLPFKERRGWATTR